MGRCLRRSTAHLDEVQQQLAGNVGLCEEGLCVGQGWDGDGWDGVGRDGMGWVTTPLPLVLHCKFCSREGKEPTWLPKGSVSGLWGGGP